MHEAKNAQTRGVRDRLGGFQKSPTFGALQRSPTFYPAIGFIAVFVLLSFTTSHFFSFGNLENVGRQGSIVAILSIGQAFVIFTGGIDLSVGPVMALSGTIMAGLMTSGVPAPIAIAAGFGTGAAFGLFNGLCVAYGHMPSIIVTLATMGAAHGLALIYTGGYPIAGLPEWFSIFGRGEVLDISFPIIITLIAYILGYILLKHMPFGRHVLAVGGNEEATRLSGIRVPRVHLSVYLISGLTAATAGLIMTSRLMSGQPSIGEGLELDSIAAVVLGGASIMGGRGTMVGTVVGAMLLAILNNGLNLVGISPYLQNVIKGAIILFAIYVGRERKR